MPETRTKCPYPATVQIACELSQLVTCSANVLKNRHAFRPTAARADRDCPMHGRWTPRVPYSIPASTNSDE